MSSLLEVQNLSVAFGPYPVVRNVSFVVEHGRTLCLVGESGCGKSMTALSLLRLQPEAGKLTADALRLEGEDLLALSERALCKVRGRKVSMIFQEPMTSLNPVLTVGDQVSEPLITHLKLKPKEALDQARQLLDQVGIPAAATRLADYPHQLSGGMRQRVMIAMALACSPSLLLADEPTTALDVTIQGQILRLLKGLSEARGMGLVLITHDLGLVAEMADDVGVMYAGDMMELAPAASFFQKPLHPYAQGLMNCAPTIEKRHVARLATIPGTVPPPSARPKGCSFAPRCPHKTQKCASHPPLFTPTPAHQVRCWLYES